ncbi:acyl-CoA dehydratase activase [Marinisporobacter balticus]|uniref:Putative CoA-substrate-specific enzyme activase n=1 Tax=Marinisporobacter balticus TaxID=2018667 RepID=A0A4R2KUL2_9FIRM|nr:acyl-CoA dehydratase activase [Marinisporobacter balticus]TCO76507.1 putative CoA-substrate-specific enzyme activase [Marinisporobacter balticus]
MFSVGIDAGSVATKGVLFNGKVVETVIIPTGWSPKSASEEVFKTLLKNAGIEKDAVKKIIGTGYGRISMDFVDKVVTEITCHAKGAHFLKKETRTILDIGGQDSKVISLDQDGNVIDFLMNDKCAAGTGRFLQVMINLLGEEIEKIDILADGAVPESITSMCTVFAESEVISLLANGASKESIAAGIIQSIANRAAALLSKINVSDQVAFTGGVAKSNVVKKAIEQKITKPIYRAQDSQTVGALGAAVVGWNIINR